MPMPGFTNTVSISLFGAKDGGLRLCTRAASIRQQDKDNCDKSRSHGRVTPLRPLTGFEVTCAFARMHWRPNCRVFVSQKQAGGTSKSFSFPFETLRVQSGFRRARTTSSHGNTRRGTPMSRLLQRALQLFILIWPSRLVRAQSSVTPAHLRVTPESAEIHRCCRPI
jgi:hypothetical protein